MTMEQLQTEIVDSVVSRQLELTITTGSTYIVTSSSTTTTIRSVHIHLPKRGPNANPSDSYVRFSLDGGLKWTTVDRGDKVSIDAYPANEDVRLISGLASSKVEMILLEEY
jgi:hypothetical protein